MSRDTDEHFHPVEYDLDSSIDSLKLAVDMCREAERAEEWKSIAVALALALQVSGWMPQSGGTEALERFKRLLRFESSNSLKS